MYTITKWIGLYRMEGSIISRNVGIYLITVRWAVCVIVFGVASDLVIDPESAL